MTVGTSLNATEVQKKLFIEKATLLKVSTNII
jgi:hypothetical protein